MTPTSSLTGGAEVLTVRGQDRGALKLRGAFYTPQILADYLAHWAIRTARDRMIDPSCGDGVFLMAAARRLAALKASPHQIAGQVLGVDIHGPAVQAAGRNLTGYLGSATAQVVEADFLDVVVRGGADSVDAAIGNPPYIRYHQFRGSTRQPLTRLLDGLGVRLTGLTNAWVPFVAAGALASRPHGRLGMVLPAELLQVSYAASLRRFLLNEFSSLTVIAFRNRVFPGVQEEVVLLLAERGARRGFRLIEVRDLENLPSRADLEKGAEEDQPRLDEKWTRFFLSERERKVLREAMQHRRMVRLGSVAAVDVGVVTGANAFFMMTEDRVREYGLAASTIPAVGRAPHLRGMRFRKADWIENCRQGLPSFLLAIPPAHGGPLPRGVVQYLSVGRRQDVPAGFKCRVRPVWYSVPSIWVPDAFLFRQAGRFPRLVLNSAGAISTDTIHRVKLNSSVDGADLVVAFHNSLTLASAEILGRSYGGGVLELQPSEAEDLPVPSVSGLGKRLPEMDALVRTGRAGEAVRRVDDIVLRGRMGFSLQQVKLIRSVWEKMAARRMARKTGTNGG